MFSYCPQCGLIQKKTDAQTNCPACNYRLNDVPRSFLVKSGNFFLSEDARRSFIETVVLQDERYSAELAAQREDIIAEKEKEHRAQVNIKLQEYQNSKPVHRCPVCASTNLTAISNVGKVTKIALLGVWGAGDLGKKWRCNSCGCKF